MEELGQSLRMGTILSSGVSSNNMVMNMFMIGIVSIITSIIASSINDIKNKFKKISRWIFKNIKRHKNCQTIIYTAWCNEHGKWTCNKDEENNISLITAILMRIKTISSTSDDINVSLGISQGEARNDYEEMKKRPIKLKPKSTIQYEYTTANKTYKIDISVCIENNMLGEKNKRFEREISIKLESYCDAKFITQFISECYEEYVEYNYKHVANDGALMYLMPQHWKQPRYQTDILIHNVYPLKTYKTFDSIFLPEKEEIMKQIDSFLNRSGQYARDGMQHKLAFLCHGTPGCGKTSFIKALANYTKRHVLELNLNNIKTGDELRELFFQPYVKIKGCDEENDYEFAKKLSIKISEKIIVFEDIDAASDIVKHRDNNTRYLKEFEDLLKKSKNKCDKKSDEPLDESSDELVDVKDTKDTKDDWHHNYKQWLKNFSDKKLTLKDVLGCLDGPIELTGGIIIMTTNHPEKLDPAIIRAGRITRRIHFTYMCRDQMTKMLDYYFPGELTPEKSAELPDKKLTPAQIECACQNSVNLEGVLNKISEYLVAIY